jgi:hypothetical protein
VELGLVAVSYWSLVLLGVTATGRWGEATPDAVLRRAQQLGSTGLTVLGIGAALVVLHAWFVLLQVWWRLPPLEEVAGAAAVTWGLLAVGWIGLLFWTIFLLRWLGVCWFRCQPGEVPAVTTAEESPQDANTQVAKWQIE